MPCLSREDFLARLLAAERPGAETILAFYDSTADAICRDGRCCFLPLSDHLCHRGDALFESVSVREGIVYALDGHMDRLRKGAESFMRLQPPCSWEDLRRHVLEVAQAAGEPDFGLRIFLGRGAGRGNSSVVHGSIACFRPARRNISSANSAHVASPSHVTWNVPRSFGRSRIARSSRATAYALVGFPCWSPTTLSTGREPSASLIIVCTKLGPPLP